MVSYDGLLGFGGASAFFWMGLIFEVSGKDNNLGIVCPAGWFGWD